MLQKFNEKNRNLIVNSNGKLVHRDQAGVSPFDSAVQGGDDWCGYEIEGDELVKTLKGPMHWSCWQDAEERGSYKAEVSETPWPLEAVTTKS